MSHWLQKQGLQPGSTMPVAQCWQLSEIWYPDRLDWGWEPKSVQRIAKIFEDVGLTSEFWHLPGISGS